MENRVHVACAIIKDIDTFSRLSDSKSLPAFKMGWIRASWRWKTAAPVKGVVSTVIWYCTINSQNSQVLYKRFYISLL